MTLRHIGAVLLAALFGLAGVTPAHALSGNDCIGSIALFGTNFCPRGTAEADGQELPISSYQALFSLIGTTYGSDGDKTFKLPNLRGKAPVDGMRYCIVLEGLYPSRH